MSQEKLEAMLTQNLEGQTKGIMVFWWLIVHTRVRVLYGVYVLIDRVGGSDGKIVGPNSKSWRTDLAALGPCAMTEGQIFSHPARPTKSINT